MSGTTIVGGTPPEVLEQLQEEATPCDTSKVSWSGAQDYLAYPLG